MSLWGEEATAKPFWNISLPCLLHCLLNLFSPVHFYIFWKSSLETKICVFSSNFSKIKMVKMEKKMRFSALKSQNNHYLLRPEPHQDVASCTGGGLCELPALHPGLLCVNDHSEGSSPSAFLFSHSDTTHCILLSWPHGCMLYVCLSTFSLVEFYPLSFALIPPGRGNKRT